MPKRPPITSNQVKAARALLGWTQRKLSQDSGVLLSTIAGFEGNTLILSPGNLNTVRNILEKAGITFTAEGSVIGPSPLMHDINKTQVNTARLVNSTELSQWGGNLRDAQSTIPELLSRLIIATKGFDVELRFPSGIV